MATTGFWPVKGSLKDLLNYAENPEKTMVKDELHSVLEYASNGEKTENRQYIAGINCSVQNAYNEMTAIKKRFGERGKNIAYHGYQSFEAGEVTPEQALQIGTETARRMWGDRYQVIVAVHCNTDNIHCHFVINSVSFKDGSKFKNKIADHKKLRQISDDICREHQLSVLDNAPFYGGEKDAYWIHHQGRKTHRDLLKAIPHNYCRAGVPRDFSSDCQK